MTTWTNTNGTNWVTTTGASTSAYIMPVTFATSPLPLPVPPETPLQWLDREVEKTCALARLKPEG